MSDEYLLQQAGEAKSIIIFGCPYCANQSIALSRGMSVIGKTSLGGIRYTPYAVSKEADRIKELFESKGKSADVQIYGPLASNPFCWMTEKGRSKIAKACENSDAAVALSCNLGRQGIKSALPDSFKVISGMTALGQITAYLSTQNGKIVLDKEKTKVYRFKELMPMV
ncbi:MAG: hypothetical protein NWE80_02835 [Candidatus Bathyarchaeota archaeon]|nr:hypothetical protein [Candidatus Bathyarchaeota archaeon]